SVFWCDGHLFLQQDVTGVESFIEQHRSHAGYRLALGNRPLDRRSAAILWQQRGMQVDVAEAWKREHPRRNDPSVAHHDNRVGRDLLVTFSEFGIVLDALRLSDWQ